MLTSTLFVVRGPITVYRQTMPVSVTAKENEFIIVGVEDDSRLLYSYDGMVYSSKEEAESVLEADDVV